MPLKATLRAVLDMTAQAGGAASDEIIDDTLLKGRYRMSLRIAWTKATQDISDFQAGVGVTRRWSEVSLAGLWREHRLTPSAP